MITVLLVGRKENEFVYFFSSTPSSIEVYVCVSENSHLITLSTVGEDAVPSAELGQQKVLRRNISSRFHQSASQMFSGFLVFFLGIFPGVSGGYAL